MWKWCSCLGHSQQQPLPWDCPTVPKLQLPAAVPSRAPASLSGACMAAARTVWFSLYLGCHRSAASLSGFNISPLTQTIARCGDQTPASVPLPGQGRSSPNDTPVFPPSSLVLPSFAWFYVFFSTGHSFLLSVSAAVLHALLCLKVYFWCIHGERYTPHSHTSLPSCFLPRLFFFFFFFKWWGRKGSGDMGQVFFLCGIKVPCLAICFTHNLWYNTQVRSNEKSLQRVDSH